MHCLHTCDVRILNTLSVSASQFFWNIPTAFCWPPITSDMPSISPSNFNCKRPTKLVNFFYVVKLLRHYDGQTMQPSTIDSFNFIVNILRLYIP